MKKTTFLVIIGTIFTLSPIMARAQTLEALQAQIQSLLALVADLQQQLSQVQGSATPIIPTPVIPAPTPPAPGESGFCPEITRNLSLGMRDIKHPGDIATLQTFLTKEGIYTYPKITGYFGWTTKKAVQTFQKKNGIVTSGTAYTTGYGVVGPKTRSLINASLKEECATPKPIETPIILPEPIVDPAPTPVPIVGPPILPPPDAPTPTPTPITSESLIKDKKFRNGIVINPVSPVRHNEVDRFIPFSVPSDGPAVWILSQWHSKEGIEGATPEYGDASVTYKNNLKSITFGPANSFSLGVYATREWTGAGKKGNQPWPHLLLSQSLLPKKPNNMHPALSPKEIVLHDQISYLKDLKEVRLKLSYTLLERGKDPIGYDSYRMAVQDQVTLFIQNRNPNSEKYGDFFYFNILLSDNRYTCSRVYTKGDVSSGKFIYSPASCDLIDPIKRGVVNDGIASDGVSTERLINKNILPHIKKGFDKAKAAGFLEGTNYDDLAISTVAFGWESSAAIDTASRYKDFDIILKKVPKADTPPDEDYKDIIKNAYSCILEREVDPVGLSHWSDLLESNKASGVGNLFRGLFNSIEYIKKDNTNEEYVTKLYTCILDRKADTSGYNAHLNRLKSGATRAEILNGFINSKEFKIKYDLDTDAVSVDVNTQVSSVLAALKSLLTNLNKK